MAAAERAALLWQRQVLRCLASEDAEAAMLLLGSDELNNVAKGRLARWHQHFNGRGPARRNTRTAPRDTKWSSILNLTRLDDPSFVTEHLSRYEWPEGYSLSTAFLWDMPESALLLNEPDTRGAVAPTINVTIPERSNGGWLSWIRGSTAHTADEVSAIKQNIERRVNFTYDTQRSTKVQRCRELFTKLMWYDFIVCLWPGVSGSRISPQMQAQLKPIIQLLFTTSDDDRITRICRDIASWCQTGRKLHETLCTHFGEASIFVLQEQLSPNFIENRLTLTGGPKTNAIAHLRSLGLQALIDREDLRSLARDIRADLSAPFAEVMEYCRANEVVGDMA